MRKFLFVLMALTVLSCSAETKKQIAQREAAEAEAAAKAKAAAPDSVMYLTTADFLKKVCRMDSSEFVYIGDKPCIIDFYTTWCGPCKRLAPIMQELAKEYQGQIYFYKVDTEREVQLAYAFQIRSIPQVLYCPMQGQPILTQGLYPKENIQQIIKEHLLKK